MKKRAAIIICVGLSLIAFMVIRNDQALKQSAKSTIVELCANYEHLDKIALDSALDKLNAATKGVRLLNVDQEQQAATFVRSFQTTLEFEQIGVDIAADSLSKADNDYSKGYRRESLNVEKQKLAQKKKEFADKMRVVLNAYQ